MSITTPYQFVNRGNLFITTPVGPSIAEVPYPAQSFTRPPDFSLWVHGQILEPGLHLDRARMSTDLYREVRDDLTRFSPVEVTRSAIRRSDHAYVGVIDSRGTPYYFALDSRGVSVREAPEAAWKAFDRLATEEHMEAVRQRRTESAGEMRRVDRELSAPSLVITKGIKYGKKVEWRRDVPHSTWWRNVKRKRPPKEPKGEAPKGDAPKGDAPKGGGTEAAEKAEAPALVLANYAAEYRRAGHELWLQLDDGESELDPPRPEDDAVGKALPRKSKEGEVKKTPSRKAVKKQAGAGGKTRYTYPQEKGRGGGAQVPLVVTHDDHKHADPSELANQLGVSVRTLRRAALRLGSDKFSTFMRSRLKTFAQKHRLDPDYWGTLYAALIAAPMGELAKSDDASKKFGDDVNRVAASVPENHEARFGDRKVFIHHVHHEMQRHGLYSGGIDKFKDDVVHAHQKGHLVAARADFVQAMDPKKVEASETKADGAHFHFINNAKHDPEAAKKLESERKPDPPKAASKPAAKRKARSSTHLDAANEMTDRAVAASAHAHKVGTPAAHLAAMELHHQAGAAHQKATGKVGSKVALAHFDQSVAHLKAAKAAG